MCAKGTRVTVKVILDCLEDGASRDEILRSYPELRPAHIEAALEYAAEVNRSEAPKVLRAAQ